MKRLKRPVALLLAALTVLSMSGMAAFADTDLPTTPPTVEGEGPEGAPSGTITPPRYR